MQKNKEAERAVAEGWTKVGVLGELLTPHHLTSVPWYFVIVHDFHTQNTLASAIKDVGKTC